MRLNFTNRPRLQIIPQLKCTVWQKNIFYEAGVESLNGKLAVAQVTENRLKTGLCGKDLCKVVYARAQFSWTLDKKKRNTTPRGPIWLASLAAAEEFKKGTRIKNLERSKFYHTNYIAAPYWVDSTKKVHHLGKHIFYSSAKKLN